MIKKAILKSFDPINVTATIQIIGSMGKYLEDIPVARNIDIVEMQADRYVAVLVLDPGNPGDMLIIAVWEYV